MTLTPDERRLLGWIIDIEIRAVRAKVEDETKWNAAALAATGIEHHRPSPVVVAHLRAVEELRRKVG